MRPRWMIWIGVVFLLLIGVFASMFQTRLYFSQSLERQKMCLDNARENEAKTNPCFEITIAADAAYSTATHANQLNLLLTYLGLMLLVGRIMSLEKRLNKPSEDSDV